MVNEKMKMNMEMGVEVKMKIKMKMGMDMDMHMQVKMEMKMRRCFVSCGEARPTRGRAGPHAPHQPPPLRGAPRAASAAARLAACRSPRRWAFLQAAPPPCLLPLARPGRRRKAAARAARGQRLAPLIPTWWPPTTNAGTMQLPSWPPPRSDCQGNTWCSYCGH